MSLLMYKVSEPDNGTICRTDSLQVAAYAAFKRGPGCKLIDHYAGANGRILTTVKTGDQIVDVYNRSRTRATEIDNGA